MAQPPGANVPTSPLCTNEQMAQIYATGKMYDHHHGATNHSNWKAMYQGLQGGSVAAGQGGYTMYVHDMHLIALAFDSLQPLIAPTDLAGRTITIANLHEQIVAQQHSYEQILRGQAPEFDAYIQQMVEEKIRAAAAAAQPVTVLGEQEVEQDNERNIKKFDDLLQEALRANSIPNAEERITQIRQIFEQMQEINRELNPVRKEIEVIQRMTALVQALLPQ